CYRASFSITARLFKVVARVFYFTDRVPHINARLFRIVAQVYDLSLDPPSKKLRRFTRLSFYPVILVPASPDIASFARSNEQIILLPPCSATLMAASVFGVILPVGKLSSSTYFVASCRVIAPNHSSSGSPPLILAVGTSVKIMNVFDFTSTANLKPILFLSLTASIL